MKLLYANDTAGQHANSWYQNTSNIPNYPELDGTNQCDVCVIGAGYTGLSAALSLASAGQSVCVLEAHRVGWGASGRNGGQLGSGFNRHEKLIKRYGLDASQQYWALAERAKKFVLNTAKQYNIDIQYESGIVNALHKKTSVKELEREVAKFNRTHPGAQLEALDANAVQSHVRSDSYYAGVYESNSGHMHPLKFAIGLAHAGIESGASLFERSPVTRIERLVTSDRRFRLHTPNGQVIANTVVCAMNGYLDGLVPKAQTDVIPINNFIVATECLGERIHRLLPSNAAVADSRFVVNYFRRSNDNRLLFGGGENYGYRFPSNYPSQVKKAMTQIFPSLHDVKIDFAWGGTLGITRSRWPSVRVIEPGLYSSSGYSGHGVAMANFCGHATAKAIIGDKEEFNWLTQLATGYIPGGQIIRPWLATAAMGGLAMIDRLPNFRKTEE